MSGTEQEKQSSRPVLKLMTPTLRFCLTLGSLEGWRWILREDLLDFDHRAE